MRTVKALLAMVVSCAAPASATWLQATSAHFVVYADADEPVLRQQARDLELFDAALRRFQNVPDTADARHNKVTIYVVKTVDALQRLLHADDVAGVYLPRVSGSVAFTPARGDGEGKTALSPRIVLFHEYAHHFLLGNFASAFPAWFSEGYAEFVSTAQVDAAGVTLGLSAAHRAYGLTLDNRLPSARLFGSSAADLNAEAMYAQGWLLTHYIEFNPDRRRQFVRYLDGINQGKPSLPTAHAAFGNLATLDDETARYLKERTLPATLIRAALLGEPQVTLRPLTAAEAALVGPRMESTLGVPKRAAAGLFARARAAVATLPPDAVAKGWLAEMAYDAGDDDAAEQAADAALALDPTSSQALLYKARVLLRRAAAKKADAATWTAARQPILRANRADYDDAAALALFYQSFLDQNATPSPGAVAGLYRAVALAPQDRTLRFQAAQRKLIDGDLDAARALLRPLAFDPHASGDNRPAKLLAILDTGKTGQAALDALDH